jgi:hypothetical protein
MITLKLRSNYDMWIHWTTGGLQCFNTATYSIHKLGARINAQRVSCFLLCPDHESAPQLIC